MAAPNTHTIDGRTFSAVTHEECAGCAGAGNDTMCNALPPCVGRTREDGLDIIWVEGIQPSVKRLTKDEINELKSQAVEKFGATWLHEFGALIEAEVYRRLGAALPDAAGDESAQAALDFDATEKGGAA